MLNYITALYVKMMESMKNEKGQTLVEYALILVLIAIVVIVALTLLGGKTSNVYNNIANHLG